MGRTPEPEWMDGGSLKHWLQDGRLYEGEALKRVLDIAIQFGRGLHYAHSYGMIHQDVKPDNVMMTQIGEAKVSDFGLAQATSTGSYTPAYCSPEQANGAPLTLATDIYSWAVSVLEMFLGDRMWMQGSIVGEELDYYLKKEMCVTMPKAMQKLLRRCLNREATARPASFTEIDPELLTTSLLSSY